MRVTPIKTYQYHAQSFNARRKNQEKEHSSVNYTLPVVLTAMSIMSATSSCEKPNYLNIDKLKDKDTTELADSTRDDEPPFDIIIDSTYNEIIEDVIIFNE